MGRMSRRSIFRKRLEWVLAARARASSRTFNAEKYLDLQGRCLPGRPKGTSAPRRAAKSVGQNVFNCRTRTSSLIKLQAATRPFSHSHDAVIRVYNEAGNVIEIHKAAGDFKEA
jgi:hypothetical protein